MSTITDNSGFNLKNLNNSSANVSDGEKITAEQLAEIRKVQHEGQILSDTPQQNAPSVTIELSVTPIDPIVVYSYQTGTARYTPEDQTEFDDRVQSISAELDAQSRNRNFSTTSILSHISELDTSKGSYFDASRTYNGYVPLDEAGEPTKPTYDSFGRGIATKTFSLEIETKDGDKVTIHIGEEFGVGTDNFTGYSGSSFGFEVEGELDEDELAAIQKLATELGQSTDAFFNGRGMAELNGLESFDREELVGFDLELQNSFISQSAEFHFEVDQDNGNQTLSASQYGLTYEFTVDTDNNLVSGGLEENAQFQSYLDLIDKTAASYKIHGVSAREVASFFKDGFSSALNIGITNQDDEDDTNPLSPEQKSVAQSIVSGLPDFEAKFFGTNDIAPNLQRPNEKSFMSLEIDQETKIREGLNSQGEFTEVTQTSNYEMDIRQHKPLNGLDLVDFKYQNYRYETLKEEGSLIRSINMDEDGSINSGLVSQSQSKEETSTEYRNGDVSDREATKEQITQTLISSDLETLQSEKANRQLGLYKVIDTLLKD